MKKIKHYWQKGRTMKIDKEEMTILDKHDYMIQRYEIIAMLYSEQHST